jgi:UDP-N-acetylglucosamine 4-epimerase
MSAYDQVRTALREAPRTWLITGVAGFIGSHLLETLLGLGQRVVGLDDFSTGFAHNLDDVRAKVGEAAWQGFNLFEGSVADLAKCREAVRSVEAILHHAGFISVPLSLQDPLACHETNVTGTLNLLVAARDQGVRRFVYASSSAVYGDDARLPKIESQIGRPLSPYGASKLMDELYAGLFADHFGLTCAGLRYFNVFGPRQNPQGGYAAVIPQWIATLLRGEKCKVHGDGEQTRDFCHVANVVQANLLAATAETIPSGGGIYNVALGEQTSLNRLHDLITEELAGLRPDFRAPVPQHGPIRRGDILHSGADIAQITRDLKFEPQVTVKRGLAETVAWYASASKS